jgi:hypothetical protein
MFLIGLGALLVLGGILYMARAAIWRGPLTLAVLTARYVAAVLAG